MSRCTNSYQRRFSYGDQESSDEDNDMPEYDRASMGELDDTDEVSIGQLKAKDSVWVNLMKQVASK